jgi:hypothetical protein
MSELAALPLTYTLPPSLLVFLTAFYLATSRYFSTDKARAYLLSALSSFTMTTLSIPFAYLYFVYGLEVVFNAAQEGWLHQAGRIGVIFFGTYLFGECDVETCISENVLTMDDNSRCECATTSRRAGHQCGNTCSESWTDDAQLALGYVMYPSQIGFLTGWVHHM